jgi:hypothetical protein
MQPVLATHYVEYPKSSPGKLRSRLSTPNPVRASYALGSATHKPHTQSMLTMVPIHTSTTKLPLDALPAAIHRTDRTKCIMHMQ